MSMLLGKDNGGMKLLTLFERCFFYFIYILYLLWFNINCTNLRKMH